MKTFKKLLVLGAVVGAIAYLVKAAEIKYEDDGELWLD